MTSKFFFVSDMKQLLTATPSHNKTVGEGYDNSNWEHHMSALMIVACLSDLETKYGADSWKKFGVHVKEFEVLKHIRNAYIHHVSDVSKLSDSEAYSRVADFLKELTKGNILSRNQVSVDPYYSLDGTVVQLHGAIDRTRSLYMQVLAVATGV